MGASKYAGLADHKAAHDEFIAKLDNWSGDVNYCKEW